MSKAIYIATMERGSGKSIVTLGLMRMLLGKVVKVGYYKPIISDLEGKKYDNHINTACTHFELDLSCKQAYAYTKSEVLAKKHEGKNNEILDRIIHKYKILEQKYDFVLVEGTDFSGEDTASELDINIEIAKNLGIPAIIVESGAGKTMKEFVNNLIAAYGLFEEEDIKVLAVVANKVKPKNLDWVQEELHKKLPKEVIVNALPLVDSLSNPTLSEVVNTLDAEVLFGEKQELNNPVAHYIVGAMQLRNYLPRLLENSLIIIPGDRADLILGALQANISENYPKISGIILSGGLKPDMAILSLIEGLSQRVPIFLVQKDTFKIAKAVGNVKAQIRADNKDKIALSIRTFEKYVDEEKLSNRLITFKANGITPRMFQYNLLKRAQLHKKHIVLPEGDDDRILKAASKLVNQSIVDITLLGDLEKIKNRVEFLGLQFDFDKINIVNPIESPYFKEYATSLYELRKHKGMNLAMAEDLMENVSYFGTMMVHKSHADGMVSGAAHTTQHTILPALQFIKTKPGVSLVSSIFFMCLEDRVSVFGDCAINPNPNAEQLAEIAISSADSTQAFGIEPRVAMLSYSSGSSGIGEDVDRVRKATEIVKKLRPDIKIEGPIQYDAAVDLEVGKSKLPNSEVAGQASVLIFPDLNTGNNTYKAVQRETGALAIGPMLQGLNKPINDLSRGCTVEDIYNTVIITAIQAAGL